MLNASWDAVAQVPAAPMPITSQPILTRTSAFISALPWWVKVLGGLAIVYGGYRVIGKR